MVTVGPLEAHVLETVLADPELGHFSVLFRVGTEVPRVDLVSSHLDLVDILDLCDNELSNFISNDLSRNRITSRTSNWLTLSYIRP